MFSRRRTGLARSALIPGRLFLGLLAALASAAGIAQVSGEILVGRAGDSLLAGSPAPDALPGEIAEPQPVILPQPVYPRAARAARQEGQVMVCFTLDERGMVHSPAVRSTTDSVFNQSVLDAISAARFTPARAGKQPVRSTACRTYRFLLR